MSIVVLTSDENGADSLSDINANFSFLNSSISGLSGGTSGSGAPSSTPTGYGQIYVDTVTKNIYISAGTSSSADWRIVASFT